MSLYIDFFSATANLPCSKIPEEGGCYVPTALGHIPLTCYLHSDNPFGLLDHYGRLGTFL